MESLLLDTAGHRRSRATMPGYHQGRAPRNKGLRYPADPQAIFEDFDGNILILHNRYAPQPARSERGGSSQGTDG